MAVPSESKRGDHCRQFGPDVVHGDKELRLHVERGKRITEPAATAIPRCPRLTRAGFAFLGHGSSLPRDQCVQRLGWNDRPATDTNSAKATSRNVIVERGPAKAGCPAGFPNAVTDLRGIVLDGLHNHTSLAGGCR